MIVVMKDFRTGSQGARMVLGAAILLGTAPIAAQAIPAEVPRLTIGALRVVLGGLLIMAVTGPGRVRAAWKASPRIRLLVAAAGIAGYQLCYFIAVARTGVGTATAVATVATPLAAGVARPLLGQGMPGTRWGIGALLTVAGGTMLMVDPSEATRLTPEGVMLAIAAGGSYAVFALVASPLVRAVGALPATGLVMLGAGVLLSPSLIALRAFPVRMDTVADVIWLVAGATAAAYAWFSRGLVTVPAERAVMILLIQPVTSAALAYPLLGEGLTRQAVIGLAILCTSVLFLSKEPVRSAPLKG